MLHVINSVEETDKRIYTFPTSQIMLHGKKSSYFDVIRSLAFPECNDALAKVYDKVDLERIFEVINETEGITETHKKFYKHMITERFINIIKMPHDVLRSQT